MDRFEQLTEQFLDDSLSAEENLELANHLRTDRIASRLFLDLYSQDRLLGELHRKEDENFINAIMAELRSEEAAFIEPVMDGVREVNEPHPSAISALCLWLKTLRGPRLAWTVSIPAILAACALFAWWPMAGDPVLLGNPGVSVSVERTGRSLIRAGSLKLQSNDILTVSGSNSVTITFAPEKTRLDVHPGTTLKLLASTREKQFDLRLGKLEATVARQRPFHPMLVRTPQAEARVLGTKLTLTTTTSSTRLDVREGKVRFTRLSDGLVVQVATAQHATAAGGTKLEPLTSKGRILREYWRGVHSPETDITLPNFPDHPTARDYLTNLVEMPRGSGNYGTRIRGYLYPPKTGEYHFWVASDDGAELCLSPDNSPDQREVIAWLNITSKPRVWTPYPWQQAWPLKLEGGRSYYIEVLHKNHGGIGHLAVSWQIPGGKQEIISGAFLAPFNMEE
jgi:hypothetical protein